jgi:cyclophilin family peptidyl-prolyl cis-trans isomerase
LAKEALSMQRLIAMVLVVLGLVACGCGGGGEGVATPGGSSAVSGTVTPGATALPDSTPTATPVAIPMVDPGKRYMARIETVKGDLLLELFAADAPVTVSNFVYLAGQGFYDNTTFHRVIPGRVAQGGDPTGAGAGGPGYFIPDEIGNRTHVKGALSMANMGFPDTAGSQFFITYEAQHDLDGRYTVFGQLVEGMEVLEGLTPGSVMENPQFVGDRVLRVTIEEG